MSTPVEPHIAGAKVLAAGALSDDWLRATIMLTPYPTESAQSLANWPSQIINWLRLRHFGLRLLVQPVTYANAENGCVTLPQGDLPFIDAQASAMETIWKTGTDAAWVDELWADAFDSKNDPKTWSTLATVIDAASTGTTLGGGKTGMATSPKGPGIPVDKVRTKEVPSEATLDWILPSRQTELSLLLEYKRALELCDTAKQVFGTEAGDLSKEIDCSSIAQRRPSDPKQPARLFPLAELYTAAHTEYKDALESAKNLYSEKPCGPRSVQASLTSPPESYGNAQRTDFEEALHEPLDSYEAANQPQKYANGQNTAYTTSEWIQRESQSPSALNQVFYSLQASPTLSRLFGLTLDVRFRGSRLREILAKQPKLPDGSCFLYLALNGDSLCRNALPCTIYTFAKYRPGPSSEHFWPASRAEVALGYQRDAREAPGLRPYSERLFDLPQYDGVMLGGRRLYTGKGFVNRFELSSLDVRSACEAALDRRAIDLTKEQLQQQCVGGSPALRPAAFARKTYLTAGLVILDRGRQQQAVSQFAARIAHQERMASQSMVLDAEDLTIGYRIDVGVPLKGDKPNYAWRGLMARNVNYGIRGRHAQRLRAIAQRLFLEDTDRRSSDPDINWRQCLEDGLLALPARLLPRTDDVKGNNVDAYVEEAIGSWAGEPMSVTFAGTRADKVKPLYGLPSGLVVSAPSSRKDPQRRTPALRFGWPYRIGLRPVYAGAISVPIEVATRLYDLDRTAQFPLGGSLTIPAVPATPKISGVQPASGDSTAIRRRDQLRRFLRHERIDAPFLLLPERLALRRIGPMGADSEGWRSAFRTDVDHDSEVMAISVPN
jgi:hypothetical protein